MSPVLFCLFINGTNKVLHNVCFLMFADNIKLSYTIYLASDFSYLQEDLNYLESTLVIQYGTWVYCILHNISKCYSISFFRNRYPIKFIYSINGNNLFVSSSSVVDLGIIFDYSLTLQPHIQNVTYKSLKMLGFIERFCLELNCSINS